MKQGKGTLSIRNDNTYTGGNRLSEGVVSVTSLANANQPKGNLGGVTTAANKFVIENGAELRTTAAVTNGSPVKFESEEGGVINNSADYIVDKAMSGTKLTKKGAGWMKLNVSNASLTRMVIMAGTVQCINANTPAKTVEFQGGTLNENTGSGYTVEVPTGKTGTWYLANRSTYTNKVTGQGTLNMYCVTEKGTNYYATRTPIQCNFNDFEGTLKPSSSVDAPALLRFTLDKAGGMPKGTMSLASNVEVQNSGKIFRIGKVTGSGSLGGGCTFSNNVTAGTNTWQVGNDDDFTFSGKITGTGTKFVKLGTGKMTVGGKWTTTGTVSVNEGELHFNTSASLGTGALTVAKDATMSGATSVSGNLSNSSFTFNGTLQVGSSAVAVTGLINFGSKNVTFNSGSRLIVGVGHGNMENNKGCTTIEKIKKLTMNGTISIYLASNYTLEPGDSIVLWQAESFEGKPVLESVVIDAEKGLFWDTQDLDKGILRVSDDVTLGIAGVYADGKQAPIFTLSGRYAGHDLNQLRPGVYLRKGKKIVIK